MSYIGSDAEQDQKTANDFRRQRSSSNLMQKSMDSPKMGRSSLWNEKQNEQNDDSDSELSDSANFLAKGAFLLTPSHELTMDRAALICEKMNFKGCFSLTKTATGILFKFSHPDDYQAVFKKGFHKVTGARFYRKVSNICDSQKSAANRRPPSTGRDSLSSAENFHALRVRRARRLARGGHPTQLVQVQLGGGGCPARRVLLKAVAGTERR